MNPKRKFLLVWILLLLLVAIGLASCGTTKKIKSAKTASSDSVAFSTHSSGYDSTATATGVTTSARAIDSNVATLASATVTRRVTFQLDTSRLRPVNDYEAAELRPVSFELDGREYKSSLPVLSVTVEDIEATVSESKSAVSKKDTDYAARSTVVNKSGHDTAAAHTSVSKKESSKVKVKERSISWLWWLVTAGVAIYLAHRFAKSGLFKS